MNLKHAKAAGKERTGWGLFKPFSDYRTYEGILVVFSISDV